jgi:hypothetical protein
MSMFEQDYVLVMVQQLARAVARIAGFKTTGHLEEALLAVRETAEGIFGTLLRTLDVVDAQSAARLLGSREKIEAYARLTAEEASIHDLAGDATRARSGERRALLLYLEAAILSRTPDADARAAIGALRRTVDERQLPPRYLQVLAAL